MVADVEEFHAAMAERQSSWPHAMTTTSTHDTKRGEDVRARIAVLAELPDVWADALAALEALRRFPTPPSGTSSGRRSSAPGRRRASGCTPTPRRRCARPATGRRGPRPTTRYERSVHAAVDAAFDSPAVTAVLDDLLAQVAGPGWSNGVAAKAIALTMPGVPDVYQGSELWEQSLVDPDNRRPVDFGVRRDVLARVLAGERPVLTPHLDDPGHAKLLVTQARADAAPEPAAPVHDVRSRSRLRPGRRPRRGLRPRRRDHRRHPAARRLARAGWGDTTLSLPDGDWADLLTGREYAGAAPLHELLADYPVALLIREDS